MFALKALVIKTPKELSLVSQSTLIAVDKRIYCPTPWFRELRESKELFSEREIRIESLWLN